MITISHGGVGRQRSVETFNSCSPRVYVTVFIYFFRSPLLIASNDRREPLNAKPRLNPKIVGELPFVMCREGPCASRVQRGSVCKYMIESIRSPFGCLMKAVGVVFRNAVPRPYIVSVQKYF